MKITLLTMAASN